MVIYFSGTGNSRWCARVLADALGDQMLDAASCIKNTAPAELNSDRPWIFAAPTYAWQLPRIFQEFLRTASFHGSRDAYFVMTCGSEIGNACKSISALCREIGLTYKGVLQVAMPENYIAMFDVPSAEESARIIAAARPVLESGIRCIQDGRPFPAVKVNTIDRLKSGIVNQGFYAYYVKAKQFRATEKCISCGRCAELCALNNIRLEGGKPVWGENCTHCMACISYCPKEAIEYGQHSVGKIRYRCEDYTK